MQFVKDPPRHPERARITRASHGAPRPRSSRLPDIQGDTHQHLWVLPTFLRGCSMPRAGTLLQAKARCLERLPVLGAASSSPGACSFPQKNTAPGLRALPALTFPGVCVAAAGTPPLPAAPHAALGLSRAATPAVTGMGTSRWWGAAPSRVGGRRGAAPQKLPPPFPALPGVSLLHFPPQTAPAALPHPTGELLAHRPPGCGTHG